MDEEKELGEYKPIKKNIYLKIFCYVCCFSGIALGVWPPILSFIYVAIRVRFIDTSKYDTSWYDALEVQLAGISMIYIFLSFFL